MPHFSGHYHDTFIRAIEAWLDWLPGKPEPTVEHEVHYVPQEISLSQACSLLLGCNDILRDTWCQPLLDEGLPLKRRTYGAAAQAMLADIKRKRRRVA
jgi:hypothetical protein